MKIVGLDGRPYNLSTRGKEVGGSDTRQRSVPHLRARALLRSLFPIVSILEEVYLPGSDGLTADFFLPSERLVIEVHGNQHFKFNPHFHKTKSGFLASLRRDRHKAEWCAINGFRLLVLSDKDSDNDWKCKIREIGQDGEGAEGEVGEEGGGIHIET